MSADSQPPAEEPRPEPPKRLPGLWVVCVLFGLTGATTLSLVFLSSAAGVAFFGGVGVVHLVVATGLWRRLKWAWVATLLLLALKLVLWSANSLTDWPGGAAEAAVPVAISLAILAYVLSRRRHFDADAPRGRFRTVSAAVAGLIVALCGVTLTLWATVDDPRHEFPELQVNLTPGPAEENAFSIIEKIQVIVPGEELQPEGGERWIDEPDEWTWLSTNAPGEVEPVPEDWAPRAERLLAANASALKLVDEALARRHFSQPDLPTGMEWFESDQPWLSSGRRTARLLAVSSGLHLLRGETAAALEDADRSVGLGLVYARRPDSLIDYLVGIAMIHIGLDQMRQVISTAADVLALTGYELDQNAEGDLGDGVRRAFAMELYQMDALVEDLARASIPELTALGGGKEKKESVWGWQFIERMPALKPNMTHNLAAAYFAALVTETYAYDPPLPDAEWEVDSLWEFADQVGWLHLVRNPVGAVLVPMLMPAMAKTAEKHFATLAGLRMTRLYCALHAYQLENGELPESLELLAPEYLDDIPVDPFTGSAFVYEPHADQPALRSVGPDQARGASWEEDGDDIVIPLEFAGP